MSTTKKRVTILGSTGSIGTSTLDVIARHPHKFEVFALTAATRADLMFKQCVQFAPQFAVMASEVHGKLLQAQCIASGLKTQVFWGSSSISMVAAHDQVDIVMAAIVGAAGLASCIDAALAGKRLLLANKEALVVGGHVFLNAVTKGKATLLPIDSEHSAIFQSLPDDCRTWSERIDKIILTASGGPFRTRDAASLRHVTPEQACAHPNWVMGRKISVDSATMMNKALEVIEAKFLFGVQPNQLEVVIHPQSVIHSMVQYKDNSVVAQLGTPDMRGPIAYGLAWPDRMECGSSPLDFGQMADLTFEAVSSRGHPERFPGLKLAWDVLNSPAGSTVVLNAANEIAVDAFLSRRLRFDQIHQVNLEALASTVFSTPQTLDDLLALDLMSRQVADSLIQRLNA